jgi:hypothetical protein
VRAVEDGQLALLRAHVVAAPQEVVRELNCAEVSYERERERRLRDKSRLPSVGFLKLSTRAPAALTPLRRTLMAPSLPPVSRPWRTRRIECLPATKQRSSILPNSSRRSSMTSFASFSDRPAVYEGLMSRREVFGSEKANQSVQEGRGDKRRKNEKERRGEEDREAGRGKELD